jgi:hypothetical protein
VTRGWFLATDGVYALCGHDLGHTVPADTPMYRLGRIFRCPEHCAVPVDWDAVNALLQARTELHQRALDRRAHTPLLRGFSTFAETTPNDIDPFLKTTFKGRKQSRPRPFSEVAGDPAVRRAQEAK